MNDRLEQGGYPDARFLTQEEAAGIFEQCSEVKKLVQGGMSLHWFTHKTRGDFLLVQGPSESYALIER